MENRREMGLWMGWLRRQGRLWVILALAAVGILLLLLPRAVRGEEAAVSAEVRDWQSEIARLETKAANLCSRVAGVGEVTVAISLAQGIEYVYAEGEGISRQALLVTERPPQISGIGVVCTGGDDPTVVETLVSLLSAAFGVGTNRIYITPAG